MAVGCDSGEVGRGRVMKLLESRDRSCDNPSGT